MLRKSATFKTRDEDNFFISLAEEALKVSALRRARNHSAAL